MSTGVVILFVLQIIIYFGVAEEMLKKMGIARNQLLLLFLGMILGSFIDIPILAEPAVSINLGGAIIPVAFAIYVLLKSDEAEEIYRTIFAILATGLMIFLLTKVYPFGENYAIIDTNYLFPIVAGLTAYIVGRSRRAAFISGILGFLIYDLIYIFTIIAQGIPGQAQIGGAGIFDSIVISGIIAVLTAEVVGEIREYIKRKDSADMVKNQFDFEIGRMEKGDGNDEKEK